MSTATSSRPIDPAIVEQKIQAAFGALGGTFIASMIHVGERLGLYRAMGDAGPLTSVEVAQRARLNERFVREWLLQQAASGILDAAPDGRFELGPEASLVFADTENPMSQVAMFAHLPALSSMLAGAQHAFREGTGNTYDALGLDVARMMDDSFGAWNRTSLVGEALPKIRGLVDVLSAGAKVADVGCGAGAGPIAVARAFPNSEVHGYDNSIHALAVGEENLAAAGVTNMHFHNPDTHPLPSEPTFDFVMTLDCLHDMARPDLAAAAIRRSIKPDGVWFIVDVDGAESMEANLQNPMASFILGASVALCLQSGASQPDGLALGSFGLPEPAMRRLASDAGFTQFKRVEGLTHPFNAYYEVRP